MTVEFKKNKTYCLYPFKAAVLTNKNGETTPCCRYKGNGEPNGLVKKGFSNLFVDIRKDMLNGKLIEGCWVCYKEESVGRDSMRTSALKKRDWNLSIRGLTNTVYSEKEFMLKKLPTRVKRNLQTPKLEYLEIESGRYCNLKCRSCGPFLSTSWDEDLLKDKKVLQNFYGEDGSNHADLVKTPKQNEELFKLTLNECKDLKEIKVTGGEPFLTDAFLKFLENLVEWGLSKNIIIEIFTNCSFFPKEKYQTILLQFRTVYINLSLDGTGKRAEFLRKKSKWSVVKQVASYWNDYSVKNKNIHLMINHTVSIFNILYLNSFIKWAFEFFDKKVIEDIINQEQEFIQLTLVHSPLYLSPYNFSKKVKDAIITQLRNKNWRNASKGKVRSILEDIIRESEDLIVSTFNRTNEVDRKEEFLEKTNLLDKVRNENWKEVFPELAELLND